MGVIAVPLLPFHGAVAADGDTPQRIQGLPNLLLPQNRTHKQRELIDLNPGGLGREKMAKLVDKDQQTEQDNCKKNTHRFPR